MKHVSWVNLIVGIWLLIAPFVYGSMGLTVPMTNSVILGILLIVSSWWILAATAQEASVSWFQFLCGIWLIIAPFVLRYHEARQVLANDIVIGVIVFVVSLLENEALARRPIKAA